MNDGAAPYKMSFSSGGLLINESVAVASGRQLGEAWSDTFERALADGAVMLPKLASNQRTLREIVNRLQCLSDEEVAFLIKSDRERRRAAGVLKPSCVSLSGREAFGVMSGALSRSDMDRGDLRSAL